MKIISVRLDSIKPYECWSIEAVRRYEALFRSGAKVPPILLERAGLGSRYPFEIYNGAHRRQGASLAGYTTIDAVVVESPHLPQPNIPDAYMGLFENCREADQSS